MATALNLDRAGYVHVTNLSGHRAEYLELFQKLFNLSASVGRVDRKLAGQLTRSPRLLFASLDDDVWGFIWVAVQRALFRRRTAAIFIRPQSCLAQGIHSRIKRVIFKLLCRLPGLSILSIVPTVLDPQMATVTTAWVYDPQNWDKLDSNPAQDTVLSLEVNRARKGRIVLTYLGRVSEIKGFRHLVDILEQPLSIASQILVVIAGRVDDNCKDDAIRAKAAGAILIDRFLTDDEMSGLYEASDLIWCCYDPSYDQSSGIFGRALQAGRCAVVRKGAVIAGYAKLTGATIVEFDTTSDSKAKAERLAKFNPQDFNTISTDRLHSWKAQSVNKIHEAL